MRDGGVRPGRRRTCHTGQTPDSLDRPVATTAEQNGVAHAHTRPTAAANQSSSLPGRSRACANSSCAPARALTRQIVTFGPCRPTPPPGRADRLDRAFRVKNARAFPSAYGGCSVRCGVEKETKYKKKTDYSDTVFDTIVDEINAFGALRQRYQVHVTACYIHCKCKMYIVMGTRQTRFHSLLSGSNVGFRYARW